MKPKRKTIRICSREWTLRANANQQGGARFNTHSQSGRGEIVIGVMGQNRRCIIEMLIHEVIESVLTHDQRRWREGSGNDKTLFCFDHNYLDRFAEKVADALISCGLIDPKKKVV